MSAISEIIIAAIVGGLFGITGTLVTLYASKKLKSSEIRENESSSANQISSAWVLLFEPYKEQIAENKITISSLEHRVAILEAQIELLGAVPVKPKKVS